MFSKSGLPDAFSVLARWLRVFYVLCRYVFSTVFFFFSSSHLCNLLFKLQSQDAGLLETLRVVSGEFRVADRTMGDGAHPME
jgi:hypothetical protein